MEKPPMEWIDKLFDCLSLFYGERWNRIFMKGVPQEYYKEMWQSAMTGCSYDEIKCALVFLKRESSRSFSIPPHHLEFYRLTKNPRPRAMVESKEVPRGGDPEVAKRNLAEIREKLRYKDALG